MGTVADIRDTVANGVKGQWLMAGLSLVGIIPVCGDALKTVGNLGQTVVKLGDDIPTIAKTVNSVVDASPEVAKYLGKSDSVVKAIQKMPESDNLTRETIEKIVKCSDEAGIVINRSSDLLKQGDVVQKSGEAVNIWTLGPIERGDKFDTLFNHHEGIWINGEYIKGLGRTFPVFDRNISNVWTSTKSIDLGTKSYRNAATLERRIKKSIEEMYGFENRFKEKIKDGVFKWGESSIDFKTNPKRVLEIIIPDIPLSKAQKEVLEKYIKMDDVSLVVVGG